MGIQFSEVDLAKIYQYSSDKHHTVVDVGAHHGSFSWPFASMGWDVVSFEPEQNNLRALLNKMGNLPNVTCIAKAVSDVSGDKVPFYVSKEHFGIHSLKPFHNSHEFAYDVETVRLDFALEEQRIDYVTLLKIDTEGADFLALKSFDFRRYKPEMIIVEFMDDRSLVNFGYTHHDMARYMSEREYAAFVSEWAPIEEYGREGVKSEPHTWLQCAPYPLDHEPAWGNLIFIPENEREKFCSTLEGYLHSLQWSPQSALRKFVKKFLWPPLFTSY